MNNIIEINDITAPELDVYARTSEVQLLRYYEPEPGLFIAESPKVIERALNAGYEPLSFWLSIKTWRVRRSRSWSDIRKFRSIQQNMMSLWE